MPVARFSEFVNVADLMAMDRTIADVVFKSDLRQHLHPLAGKSFANARIAGQILSESLGDSLRSIRSRSGK
jgi:N12 class adenine-specific DNA methylase